MEFKMIRMEFKMIGLVLMFIVVTLFACGTINQRIVFSTAFENAVNSLGSGCIASGWYFDTWFSCPGGLSSRGSGVFHVFIDNGSIVVQRTGDYISHEIPIVYK